MFLLNMENLLAYSFGTFACPIRDPPNAHKYVVNPEQKFPAFKYR